MSKRTHTYPKPVLHAAELLGAQVREARLQRRWSVRELAERAGITTGTLHKVEHGDPTVLLGTAFDVATLVGVPLYHEDHSRLADAALHHRARLALLPRAVRPRAGDLDNDF